MTAACNCWPEPTSRLWSSLPRGIRAAFRHAGRPLPLCGGGCLDAFRRHHAPDCNLSETVLAGGSCTDVASLWSAARVQQYLGETGSRERVGLVLNRFRKIPGFSEADAEAAAGVKLLWKIPNQYFAISTAIDRGIPVMAPEPQRDRALLLPGWRRSLTRTTST